MNKNIQALYDQCVDPLQTKPWPLIDANKFANLIILEAARIVDIWSDEEPCSEGYDVLTVNKLKSYFGIEDDSH